MKRNQIITVTTDKRIKCSGYNPYQTGHGVYEDKSRKRSYRKRQLQKQIAEYA